ncbi:MAG: hypothetical protein HQ515_22120 [Phycisphaeraceae bacterium]|nr:hypothetical protein [Phycisphaeraceae bacterium]
MEAYGKVRPALKTGDIVLFSGKGGISTGIKWFTDSKWSHVGMVLRLPEWDAVLLWESTTLGNIADVESGKEHKGVQLVPLSERIQKYQGEASIRLLDIERTPEMLKKLSLLRAEVKGRQYEKHKIELFKAAYDGPFGANREDLSSLFCSEMVAEAYQRMGLLSEKKASNEYTPRDFCDKAKVKLKLLKGAKLAKEVLVSA